MATNFVNQFAPKADGFSVYFKKVIEKKSDGFVVISGSEVYVIDAGRTVDDELAKFLVSLRTQWLANQPDPTLAEDPDAKLAIHIIVSHPHPDHIGAMPFILTDPRFCVLSFRGPCRSYLSLDVEGALPPLIKYENSMDTLEAMLTQYGHIAQKIQRIPYGVAQTISLEDGTVLDLYPSHYDWSTDRPSESEGFRFLKKFSSPTYASNPDLGYTNGILNGNSLWVKITNGTKSVLITGDQRASDEMLGSMIRYYGEDAFRCDVLKLPHHGEKNYCPYLLEVAAPTITIFTTTEQHVTPETQELCHKIGDVYYLYKGNLVLMLNENGIQSEGIQPGK